MNKNGKDAKISYEEAIFELEEIVKMLENGDLSLEHSIELFQKGMELSRYCSKKLDEAERKITLLIENEKGEFSEQAMPET
jgi:exodeoxyribonuclease VII small subunit